MTIKSQKHFAVPDLWPMRGVEHVAGRQGIRNVHILFENLKMKSHLASYSFIQNKNYHLQPGGCNTYH
jgi:hypothetical protein